MKTKKQLTEKADMLIIKAASILSSTYGDNMNNEQMNFGKMFTSIRKMVMEGKVYEAEEMVINLSR